MMRGVAEERTGYGSRRRKTADVLIDATRQASPLLVVRQHRGFLRYMGCDIMGLRGERLGYM